MKLFIQSLTPTTVEVLEWISDIISHFIMYLITYPWQSYILAMGYHTDQAHLERTLKLINFTYTCKCKLSHITLFIHVKRSSTHWGMNKKATILQTTFSYVFLWKNIFDIFDSNVTHKSTINIAWYNIWVGGCWVNFLVFFSTFSDSSVT